MQGGAGMPSIMGGGGGLPGPPGIIMPLLAPLGPPGMLGGTGMGPMGSQDGGFSGGGPGLMGAHVGQKRGRPDGEDGGGGGLDLEGLLNRKSIREKVITERCAMM